MSAVSKLSLRRGPIRLVLSRGPWAAAWYLLGYLAVGWALFATALGTAVAGAGLSITFAGLPVLVAAAAAIRWCADAERARLRPVPLENRIRQLTCRSSGRQAARTYSLIRPPGQVFGGSAM